MGDVSQTTALLRLMAWLSPAFPIGSFAYSGGLERAVHDGLVTNVQDLDAWLSSVLTHGAVWNDAVLMAEAHTSASDPERLTACAELAEALAGSRERHQETMLLGEAFLAAASAWPQMPMLVPERLAYPVAVGAVAAAHGIGARDAIAAYLHAFVSQGVSASIRLSVCGQRDGVEVLAGLEAMVATTAAKAAFSTLDDLGSAAVQADIVALRHETQRVRLFRS
ncbi:MULTISPECIES: urease accessory protein UreF [unclassified Rhizobium]|uniref:urease accessory protein UreF n=1 Tax=unclassified Rhizobium TaxID=2613769 RepID=UPI001ADB8CB5|nr:MULTISPECIES: urease accessory protein UreF [unclassified Rhizobium]MBO9099216.1 urease accessory protein UreF [Rhizobium sp. L58/93]MBO9131978.1 urease accessory protein UreF [Rhizobium sp. B209b/85]MBO9169478.1 urease accessory protein UreF [Rhizobium sp. L245/93]MBO9185429.1 urease accessory protein UreF [Rhizobium sp. E27B/91]QXZ85564.1 urease accessory protein UreF [Rhizobium sp. K1/93]